MLPPSFDLTPTTRPRFNCTDILAKSTSGANSLKVGDKDQQPGAEFQVRPLLRSSRKRQFAVKSSNDLNVILFIFCCNDSVPDEEVNPDGLGVSMA